MTTLGDRIRTARLHARLSQSDLEQKSGVSQKTISKLELNEQKKTTQIVALARACGVRADWLATGEGSMVEVAPGVEQDVARYGEMLSTEALEVARMWQDLVPERREHYRQTIMVESVIGDAIGARVLTPKPHEWRREFAKRVLRAVRNSRKDEK